MTIQEAIENIKKLREYIECASFIDTAKIIETYDMAIRSLEAWEKVKEEMGDMSILSSYQLKSGEPTTTLYEGLCRHDEVLQIINRRLSEVEGEG